MENGWIKLYRKSTDSRVFQNEGLWKVWTWCLLKANHKEQWASITTGRGTDEILVKPGQFIYGRKSAAKELKMPESSVRNRIEKLKKAQNLDIKTDTHCSIISIINWDSYQTDEIKEDTQKDRQRTPKGQAKDTNKNVKNVKNEKKSNRGEKFIPPTIEEVTAYCLERKNGVNPKKWWNHYQAKGWMIGKNKMKDWKAAVVTWETEKSDAKSRHI
jgi:hypothetical protein